MPTQAELDAEAVSLVTHPSGVQGYIMMEYLYINTRIRVSRSTQSGLCCIHSVLATAVVLVSLLARCVSSACSHDAPCALHTHTGAGRAGMPT